MSPQSDTMQVPNGPQVAVEYLEPTGKRGARFDIEADDGRKWRVDVTKAGEVKQVVTTWEDGVLADLDEPDWLTLVTGRLGGPV